MKVLRIYPNSINGRHMAEAVDALRDGGVILYPTDTLYAFGCDALNNRAVERLCRIKGLNPEKNLLSVVCADISQAAEYARIDNRAFRYLKQYFPGPYTFVLPSATTLPRVFRGRKNVGIRVPDNPIATELARALGNPVMTGSVSYDDAPEVVTDASALALKYNGFDDISLAIDGGDGITVPSTVVSLLDSSAPEVIRVGAGEFQD